LGYWCEDMAANRRRADGVAHCCSPEPDGDRAIKPGTKSAWVNSLDPFSGNGKFEARTELGGAECMNEIFGSSLHPVFAERESI
jgi:hypothetical protein